MDPSPGCKPRIHRCFNYQQVDTRVQSLAAMTHRSKKWTSGRNQWYDAEWSSNSWGQWPPSSRDQEDQPSLNSPGEEVEWTYEEDPEEESSPSPSPFRSPSEEQPEEQPWQGHLRPGSARHRYLEDTKERTREISSKGSAKGKSSLNRS